MSKRPPQQALLAAAKRLTKVPDKKRGIGGTSTGDSWQNEAWEMYDLVGELRFVAGNIAGQGAKATIFVGKQEPGEDEPTPLTDDDTPYDFLTTLGNSQGSLFQMVHRMILNLFIPGECWLVGVPNGEERLDENGIPEGGPGTYDWHTMSISEIGTATSGGEVTLTIEGDQITYDADDLFLARIWRPHPRKQWEADSPARSSLPVLRELVGLTMHVYAQIESRLAGAGLLIVPQSAQRALQQASGIEETDESRDEFTEALIEAMVTPVGDRSSASAIVPLTVTVPDEAVDAFKHISFSTDMDGEARELRDESIRRLALGLDAPPELLLGTGSMNHWGGWLVQEETVTSHIVPVLALICDALTTQFLWPFLEQAGYTDVEDYVVWYDVDHLIARPNLASDAHALHDKGVLSDESLRRASGFDDADAPEKPADLVTTTVLGMIRTDPSLAIDPGVESLRESIEELLGDTAHDEVPTDESEQGTPDTSDSAIPDTAGDDAELADG